MSTFYFKVIPTSEKIIKITGEKTKFLVHIHERLTKQKGTNILLFKAEEGELLRSYTIHLDLANNRTNVAKGELNFVVNWINTLVLRVLEEVKDEPIEVREQLQLDNVVGDVILNLLNGGLREDCKESEG